MRVTLSKIAAVAGTGLALAQQSGPSTVFARKSGKQSANFLNADEQATALWYYANSARNAATARPAPGGGVHGAPAQPAPARHHLRRGEAVAMPETHVEIELAPVPFYGIAAKTPGDLT